MRCEQKIRDLAQRMIRRKWFLLVRIDNRTQQMTVRECVKQCLLVDNSTSRHVHDNRLPWQPCKLALTDHARCLVRKRRVHSEDVRFAEEVFKRLHLLNPECLESALGDVGIIRNNIHPKRSSPGCNLAADSAESNDSERPALQLRAE